MYLTIEAKLEQLEKILHSRALQGSENLKAFLRYVVEKAVDSSDPQLREHIIATEVFGRAATYDSRTDSVVRVQAGRLRAKLSEYYATEGQGDTIKIELPKGHYCPAFSYNNSAQEIVEIPELAAELVTAANIVASQIADTPPLAPERGTSWSSVWLIALATATLFFASLALKYGSEVRQLRRQSQTFSEAPQRLTNVEELSPLWGEFFKSAEPTLVAYSNTIFRGRAETGMKLLNTLDATGSQSRSQQMAPFGVAEGQTSGPISDHYTGVGEVMSIYFLGDLFWKANHPFRVKRSLLLTWDDVKNNNIVMLGSPAENFLLRELPQTQDFVFKVVGQDSAGPVYGIMNLKPQPGEQEIYVVKEDGPSSYQVTEDYALVTLLKGLDDRHRLMILAGIKTYGTQAATEYVTRPESFKELLQHLKPSSDAPLPSYYQVLLKVKINDGVPVQTSYVTHHVLD